MGKQIETVKVALLNIAQKVNWTIVITSLIGAMVGYNHLQSSNKQDVMIQKQDTTDKKRGVLIAKVDSMNHKLDLLLKK